MYVCPIVRPARVPAHRLVTEARQCARFPLSWPVSGLARQTIPPSYTQSTRTVVIGMASRHEGDACLPLRGQHTLARRRGHLRSVFPV
jgi:hypothetical protein